MIKRILSLILALVMVLGLCACGSGTGGDTAPGQSPEAAPSAQPQQSDKPADGEEESQTPAGAASEPFFDATVSPGETPQVIYLTGSWHDMGVQYAQQEQLAMDRQYIQSATTMLQNVGGDVDKLYAAIDEYMEQVKTECPDLYAFVEGVDEGAEELDFEQSAIATVCCLAYVEGAASDQLNCMNISAWGEATESGHLLAATNGDTELNDSFQYHAVMVLMPENGHKVICSSGANSNAYMNDQGVIALGSGGQSGAEGDVFTDLISTWAMAYTMTQVNSADETLEAVGSDKGMFRAWLGNLHIVDTTGVGYIYESTAAHSAVRKMSDNGEKNYLIANNSFLTDEMQSSLYNDGNWEDCPVRYATVEQVFTENYGALDIGLMHEAIASRRYYMDGWSDENWSLDYDTYYSSDSSDIIDKTTIRTLLDANDLIFYRQLGSSDPFNNHNPNATSRFFRINLMDTVFDINLMADVDAQQMIWYASRDLDKAVQKDEAKIEQLNAAKEQYITGTNYSLEAGYMEAKGDINAANAFYSKASTAYALAQEYAQNAMIEDNSYTAIDGESHTR